MPEASLPARPSFSPGCWFCLLQGTEKLVSPFCESDKSLTGFDSRLVCFLPTNHCVVSPSSPLIHNYSLFSLCKSTKMKGVIENDLYERLRSFPLIVACATVFSGLTSIFPTMNHIYVAVEVLSHQYGLLFIVVW